MATKSKKETPQEPDEVEIPESDDLPDEDEEEPEADDEPHGHLHSPGYPDHLHKEHGIAYVADQVDQAGGLHLFPESRHDADKVMAESAQAELESLDSLTPLMNAFVGAASELGWQVGEERRSWIASSATGSFSLFGKHGQAYVRVEFQ